MTSIFILVSSSVLTFILEAEAENVQRNMDIFILYVIKKSCMMWNIIDKCWTHKFSESPVVYTKFKITQIIYCDFNQMIKNYNNVQKPISV